MIEKLKKAGLGYYVKDDNTQQKFGKYYVLISYLALLICIVYYTMYGRVQRN